MLELNSSNLSEYLFSTHKIPSPNPSIESLSGGVSALVFKITTANSSFIVKQACSRLRVKDLWVSDPSRIEREFLFLSAFKSLLPRGSLTDALWYDAQNHVLGMSTATAPATPWKKELLSGIADPLRASQAGELLATIHGMGGGLRENYPKLADKTIFQQLRIEPFYERLEISHPRYAPMIRRLRDRMLIENSTICHGDFSPKNLLTHPGGLTLVDHETAHFGDPTMDVGLFMAHLVLKAIHAKSLRPLYADLIRSFLESYVGNQRQLDFNYQQSSLGHLGVVLLTRVSGTSQVDYLDESQKQEAAKLAHDLLEGEIKTWKSFPPCSW